MIRFFRFFIFSWASIAFVSTYVQVQKFEFQSVPESSWLDGDVIDGANTEISCAIAATKRQGYYHTFDESAKTCKIGAADVNATVDGGATKRIAIGPLANFSHVGLVHTTQSGVLDFDVLMPKGKICPPSDHGIPGFDAHWSNAHAAAELDGAIYVVGGAKDGAAQDHCRRLDLTSPAPTWETLQSMPAAGTPITAGGLVPYKHSDGTKSLFVVFVLMCSTATSQGYIRQYHVETNTWSLAGRSKLRGRYAIAYHGQYIYYPGGQVCDTWVPTKKIQLFDMEDPKRDPEDLEHELCSEDAMNLACAVHRLGGQLGLLCAGGWDDTNHVQTNNVQFVPLNTADGSSAGECRMLDPLPAIKDAAYMFSFGNGQLALYGGQDKTATDGNSPSVLLWDPAKQVFTDDRNRAIARSVANPALTHLDKNLVMKGCWRHLI